MPAPTTLGNGGRDTCIDNASFSELCPANGNERFDLSGAAHEGTEFEKWCSEESEIFLALEAGTATFANLHEQFEGVLQIGEAPVAGTSANG